MTDSSGILEELQAERKELEKLQKIAKNISKESIFLSSAPFYSLEEKDGKLLITGIALAEGIWKNVFYPADELEKAATNLEGKPVLVEHGLDEKFKKEEVGKVKQAYYDKTLRSIVFQAEVTDPEAIKCIKDGTFPAVSCSTWVDKFPINAEQSIGFNFNFNELSLVKAPACEKCFIFAVEELTKRLCEKKQDLNIQSPQMIEEVKQMTDEKEEIIEELEEDEVDLSELEKPKMYAVVEVEALSDFDEELAKKVVSYYYGYYYPYGYKGKYPYPHYPYYPYYPYYGKKGKYKKPEKKSLWALLELETPEEIEALKKKGKKVVSVYYGYYGYPHYAYPYYGKKYPYYGYPYYPYYGYPYYPYYGKYPEKKGVALVEEEGQDLAIEVDEEELEELKKKKKVKGYYPYYPYYKKPEKKAEEAKCPEGQVSDEKEKKCVPMPEEKSSESTEESLLDEMELAEDYKEFMKKCMKESKEPDVIKRMKACAVAWKEKSKEEKAKKVEPYPCPEGTVWDENEKKCKPIEGKEKYPMPEKETAREWTDIPPGRIETPPGPAEEAAKIASKEKLSIETVKKEETPLPTPEVQVKMTEAKPCEECPKKEEEKKEETKKEETTPTTVEAPKPVETKEEKKEEVPASTAPAPVKEEAPKTEAPKEIPKTPEEAPKEAPKEEKEPTEEEIKKYVKEHWEEILVKLIKEKKI